MRPTLPVSALALLLAVSACANPVVAPPVTPADSQKSCAEIEADIARTAQLKREARADDEFQWRYVFIVNAATSWHRMNKAEDAAVERLAKLNDIAKAKGCMAGQEKLLVPGTPPTPQPDGDALPEGRPAPDRIPVG